MDEKLYRVLKDLIRFNNSKQILQYFFEKQWKEELGDYRERIHVLFKIIFQLNLENIDAIENDIRAAKNNENENIQFSLSTKKEITLLIELGV